MTKAASKTKPAAAANPPNLNNMGGLNPQKKNLPYWIGLDWLTINFQIDWVENWETEEKDSFSLRPKLLDLVTAAQETGDAVEIPEWDAVIYPGGGKIGTTKKGKYCKFRIERPDGVFLIADAQRYSGDWPNVQLKIDGEQCLIYPGGAQAAYESAIKWVESLGGKIHKERVSRVDICADFPGLNIKPFEAAYDARHWTSRAKEHHPYHSNGLSLNFGSGDIRLRIYDKLAEMRASALRGQPAKYEHMIQKRWGGKEPKKAIRVEYQLRRGWLKQYGINDLYDLQVQLSSITGYLTGFNPDKPWFRFLCDVIDNKHPERNKVLPEWQRVQNAFLEVFKRSEKIIKIDPDRADVKTLLMQAFGVLESAAANKGFALEHKKSAAPVKYQFPDYEAFEQWICVQLRSVALEKKEWQFKEKPVSAFSEEYELFLRSWEIKTNKGK